MFRKSIQVRDDAGQTMAEYAVVLCVITLAIVTTIAALSGAMNEAFERTIEIVDAAT